VVQASKVEFVTALTSGKDNENRTFPGTVSSYDAASGAFRLVNINLAMQINEATKFYSANHSSSSRTDFAVGDRVLVRGNFVSGVLVASEIRFAPNAEIPSVKVEGVLYELDAKVLSFKLNGTTIVYKDGTVFENGSAADLANAVRVHVTASLVGGQWVASKIEIRRRSATVVEARGAISGYVSSATFTVASQVIDASGSGVKFEDGAAADLANGRIVEVSGTLSGTTLIASQVEFKD
jgi:hypothetical protein